MYKRRKTFNMNDFQPDIEKPKPVEVEKVEEVEIIRENPTEPKKMNMSEKPVVIKSVDKTNKQTTPTNTSFDGLKNKFLLYKNKHSFIKRNKDLILQLSKEDQRKFINLAKEHFET